MISEITTIKSNTNPASITVPSISLTNRRIVEIDGGANTLDPSPPYKYTQLNLNDTNLVPKIEKLYIGENVKNLSRGATLSKLREIKFKSPELSGLTDSMFSGATELSCVEGLENTKISFLLTSCFCNCSKLSSVSLPSTITAIGVSCFCNCSKLSSVSLPSTITAIGEYCFSESNVYVNEILDSLPEISSLPVRAFSKLTNQTLENQHIIIPSNITSIGVSCFYLNGFIQDVTFGAAANINDSALRPFEGSAAANGQLSAIYFYRDYTDDELSTRADLSAKSIPTIASSAFYSLSKDFEISVYVPTYLYNDWSNDTSWNSLNSSYRQVKILPYNDVYPSSETTSITLDNSKSYVIVDKNYQASMNFGLNSTNELSANTGISAEINVYTSNQPDTDEIDDTAFDPENSD